MSPKALIWSEEAQQYVPLGEQAAAQPLERGATPEGPETVTGSTVHLGAGAVVATVLRLSDRSLVTRLQIRSDLGDAAGVALTRAQLAALREMLSQMGKAMLEAEWT